MMRYENKSKGERTSQDIEGSVWAGVWMSMGALPAWFGWACLEASRRHGDISPVAGAVYGWLSVLCSAVAVWCLLEGWKSEREGCR